MISNWCNWHRIVISVYVLLAGGCAALGPVVPGDTIGSPQLQRDTVRQLLFYDQIADKECTTRKVVNTEVIEAPKNSRTANGVLMEGSWKERWHLDRCGSVVTYDIEFQADGKGGTYLDIPLKRPR